MKKIKSQFGIQVIRRLDAHGSKVVTEQGTICSIAYSAKYPEPEMLSQQLRNIPGVLETGLYVGLASKRLSRWAEQFKKLGPDWDHSPSATKK